MNTLERNLGVANENWLMSAREKLCLIGLLELLRPQKSLEFGFHRGGATAWLAKFSETVITVDVNEHVNDAPKSFPNVTSWNCPTEEAVERIKKEMLSFDLAIIDADHSRKAVARDLKGILPHAETILLHDSSNPDCRKGMLDILDKQDSHAYSLDLISSSIKHDGLWGGLGIAVRSEKSGLMKEFKGEFSPYNYLSVHHSMLFGRKFSNLFSKLMVPLQQLKSKVRIKIGGLKS